eukprot:TRINITY_DN625_c0_g1_i2.p1 TRINITY_DN625_c0_g1~~TRINITY_DN625_c0_g1_i2.p1  ORF type:complete len:262 (+),score=48.70 TRINITY_DN625_c0_g1_i2:47-787(+)
MHGHTHEHADSHHSHSHEHDGGHAPVDLDTDAASNLMAAAHSHEHAGAGHTHEHLEHAGCFHDREPPLNSRDLKDRAFTVGIGGPVGSGKTALMLELCKRLRDNYSIAAVTNDIFTREDAEFLTRNAALAEDRIAAIETGGCPHAAIREDISANLSACEIMTTRHACDIVLVESGGGERSCCDGANARSSTCCRLHAVHVRDHHRRSMKHHDAFFMHCEPVESLQHYLHISNSRSAAAAMYDWVSS